jgi:cell division transport system permease protein
VNSHQASYLFSEAFRTVGRHKAVTVLSIVIMSLTLLVLAVFLLATDNVLTFLDRERREMTVFVYLKDDVPQRVIDDEHNRLLRNPVVETAVFITKEQALREFRAGLGEEPSGGAPDDILEVLETNPLPASFRVTLRSEHRTREAIERFAETMRGGVIVEDVSYGREFIEQFSAVSRGFLYVDLVLGLIVVLSSVFIISNTVKLTILSRQKTIEVLKFVGATNRFIVTPFVIEGAFQAGVSSLVSLALLFGIYALTRRVLPDLGFLQPDKILLYIGTCVMLGAIGSLASLRRHLRLG